MCQLCHIRKLSATTICLFLFILLNLFTKITVYTDYVPVTLATDNMAIHFYRNGTPWAHANMYEFVETLQLLWLIERIIKFSMKSRRDKLRLTNKAKISLGLVCLIILEMTISRIIPHSMWGKQWFIDALDIVDMLTLILLIFNIGYGKNKFFITDENNEVVYFADVPNPEKLKRRLEKLISLQKIHRTEGLTIITLAKLLDTNTSTIADLINKEYGMTFSAFLAKKRIDDAKSMIKENPDMNLSDIAISCGFNSAVNFSKAFKKETGMSASEWIAKQ